MLTCAKQLNFFPALFEHLYVKLDVDPVPIETMMGLYANGEAGRRGRGGAGNFGGVAGKLTGNRTQTTSFPSRFVTAEASGKPLAAQEQLPSQGNF